MLSATHRVMENNEELQNLEIQALKSIYLDEFFDNIPPKAWKSASRLPEFNVKVKYEDSSPIYIILDVKFPKSYPSKSTPLLSITRSNGLTPQQVSKLTGVIHAEAQRCLGNEAIFAVIQVAQEWLRDTFQPPSPKPAPEASGLSLALEMQNRELEQERVLRVERETLEKEKNARELQFAEQFREMFERDVQRKEEMRNRDKEQERARRRAMSDVTEKPIVETSIESFDDEMEVSGIRFDTVRLYHGRRECLGVTYNAEPVTDDQESTLALELHVVTFESSYYKTQQGKKKIDQVENEIKRLIKIDNCDHVQRIFAVKLTTLRTLNNASRLVILMEKKPALTLKDVLQDSDGLREDRARAYLIQICHGLRAVHDRGLVHRAINPGNVGLVEQDGIKIVKLINVAFATKLHDLHNSDPFGPNIEPEVQEPRLPDDWVYRETLESPLTYTRCRDMNALGVLMLQMVMGLDVMARYPSPRTALPESGLSSELNTIVFDMLRINKKSGITSASDVLDKLDSHSRTIMPRSIPIPTGSSPTQRTDIKTPVARIIFPQNSPQTTFFVAPESRARKSSRWRDDWQQLDILGKGGFGQVVKARNLVDGQIYAVKKIKLRTAQSDNKIFREVNALSRLSHRFIVRYYTTWLEESDPTSSNVSSNSGSYDPEDQTAGASFSTEIPDSGSGSFTDPTSIDLDELMTQDENQTSSFPSIHFTSGDVADDSSDEEDIDSLQLAEPSKTNNWDQVYAPPMSQRTLYIQMEYVERQTLKELVAEGISVDEAWRLFQQIVDALVHMASLGILHRDIKLTNIFIDSNGNCKVGDFGLATSSLAAVDPSDVSPMSAATFSDMTMDVGTRLYIAPEILSKRGGSRDKDVSKADLYSLGVVFFEMNYFFSTASERIFVIENLRHPEIIFPEDWDPKRHNQREIIQQLLQHDPTSRPNAIELSQSPLLPPKVEDEYFKAAISVMLTEGNRYYPAVISSLFSKPPRPTGEFLYDYAFPETAILRQGVIKHLTNLFRLHGARDVDVPLLMPLTNRHLETQRQVILLDTHGEVVTLPSNALLPFARLAARLKTTRIKRYHIGDTYRVGMALAHPTTTTAAIFDIITQDTTNGPIAACVETITLMDECLGMFPNLAKTYQINVSHSTIHEIVMKRVPQKFRDCVVDVLQEPKIPVSQKRMTLLKKGLSKNIVDELDWLYEDYEDITVPLMRLEKVSSPLIEPLTPLLKEIARVVGIANASGIANSSIRVQPLMIGRRHDYFKNGVCFEVFNPQKRTDILAVGGRYDHLINQFYPPSPTKREPFIAFGVQIALERITSAIATFQKNFLKSNARSYDYWMARRCDVYVVSFQPGHLDVRLEVVALLWRNGIRADLMYENSVSDTNMEALVERCYNEGILFTILPKVKSGQMEPTEFKVKSVLKGTEYEISRQELVPWLQQQISEQKRIESASSGVSSLVQTAPSAVKESSNTVDIQMVLPGEGTNFKKQRKTTKQIFFDKAYEKHMRLKLAMQSGSVPTIAIDVPPAVFDSISRSDAWLTDDEAWRTILPVFPTQHMGYANQIRETILRKSDEGAEMIILFSVKEERVGLLTLKGHNTDHRSTTFLSYLNNV